MRRALSIAGFACVAIIVATPASAAACFRYYKPVCGEIGGVRKDYANSCVAEAQGARIAHQGHCRQTQPPGPTMCTMDYNPVCGVKGGARRTYGNACAARGAGARIVHRGECGRARR
jgi:hypothetical protein